MAGLLYDLGPCDVVWGAGTDGTGGTNLGETEGGVIFTTTDDTAPVKSDQKGTQPIDEIFTGSSCQVEVNLTRTTLANLASITPGASGSGTTATQMVVRNNVGESMYDSALRLILKPYDNGAATTTTSKWLTIFKAASRKDWSVPFNKDGQRVYKTIFKGFPVQADETSAKAGWLYKIGA